MYGFKYSVPAGATPEPKGPLEVLISYFSGRYSEGAGKRSARETKMTPWRRIRGRCRLALTLVLTLLLVGCDNLGNVKTGMNEKEVRSLLGEPSLRISDAAEIKQYGYGWNTACKEQPRTLLIFLRTFLDDSLVGLGEGGLVVCTWNATIIDVTVTH